MGLHPLFAQHLADRRDAFNTLVATARVRNPSFDTPAFTRFVTEQVNPLVAQVLALNTGSAPALFDVVFETAITLTEHRWAGHGARADEMARLWGDVLPAFAPIIATHPKTSIAMLTNAAITVMHDPHLPTAPWLESLTNIGPLATTPNDARNLIIIATWRAGAAHIRDAALTAAAQLPPDVACASVGQSAHDNWSRLAENFAAHPWWAPDTPDEADGHHIGAFAGFGGLFHQPPVVNVVDDRFVVTSGTQRFALFADAYGASLRPHDTELTTQASTQTAQHRLDKGDIRADDRLVPIALPVMGLRITETSDSIAVTSPYSHRLHVFPKVSP
jgi:hypothetical protein